MHNNICAWFPSFKGPDDNEKHLTSMLKNKRKISSIPS